MFTTSVQALYQALAMTLNGWTQPRNAAEHTTMANCNACLTIIPCALPDD